MTIEFTKQFKQDSEKLKKEDKKLFAKVLELIIDTDHHANSPLEGKGKPEKLTGNLAGFYSRRINQKHRLIYTFEKTNIKFISCYGHYQEK